MAHPAAFQPRLLLTTFAVLAALALSACDKPKGPAERAGENIDKATQNLHDAVDPPKGPAESVGRKIDRIGG